MTYSRRSSSGSGFAAGCLIVFVLFAIYVGLFFWYANTIIPRPYPTEFNGFWSALAHGIFAAPTFILSLLNDNVAIYQTPNTGGWYDFGFLLGAGALFSISVRVRFSRD